MHRSPDVTLGHNAQCGRARHALIKFVIKGKNLPLSLLFGYDLNFVQPFVAIHGVKEESNPAAGIENSSGRVAVKSGALSVEIGRAHV